MQILLYVGNYFHKSKLIHFFIKSYIQQSEIMNSFVARDFPSAGGPSNLAYSASEFLIAG